MSDDAPLSSSGRLATWWWDLSLRAKGILALVLPGLVLVPAMIATVLLVRNQEHHRQRGREDRTIELDLESVRQLVDDAESGVRGYLLTDDEAFLDRYEVAAVDFGEISASLEARAGDELGPRTREITTRGTALLDQLGELRDEGAPAEPGALTEARTTMDGLRTTLDEVETIVQERQRVTRNIIDVRGRTIFFTLVGGILVGAIGGLTGIVLFTRSIGKRVQLVSEAAARVLGGGPIGPIETPADDEIGRLVNQLSDAAGMLIRVNDEITASRDEALAATQAKDEFLSRMSHELRTPLSAILGFGQLLQMEDLSPDDRSAVDHIVKAGRHLLGLINDLLDISRISTGHLSLSLEPIALADLVDGVVSLLRPQANERGIEVRVDVDADVMVVADNQRLKQVVLNLLSNAIKYNRRGGTIDIEATSFDDIVRLEVSDTGTGITAEGRARLFMPFERLDATNTTIEGAGVGLALSKSLVEVMAGEIGVESEPLVGSTFWVELPEATDVPGDHVVPVAPDVHRDRASAGEAMTVLYVEDNLANVRVMERLLRDRPEHLEVTLQGGLALDLARRLRPGLVLLDLHLPDLAGDRVLTELKGDPATADIPVVMLSADASEGARQRLLDLGAHAFLTKPIDIHGMLDLLEDVAASRAGTT